MKILIADDDRTNRLLLAAQLRRDGWDVVTAQDGREAVLVYEAEQPDLVLMDVLMPVMDGYEATRRIKERASERFVPVIFLTALDDDETLAQAIEAGGDDVLTKPFSRFALLRKITAFARMRQLHATVQAQRDELAMHQRHLEREQELAERIFSGILHPGRIELPQVRFHVSPQSVFNGDLVLAARRPNGGLHLLVGDFTGHGLSAAIGALPVSGIFHGMTEKGFDLPDIVEELHRKLQALLPVEIFLAATLIAVDARGRRVAVWNGGLPDVLLVRGSGAVERFPSRHLPLGVGGAARWAPVPEVGALEEGDRLYAYTDGVVEAVGAGGEAFGEQRVVDALAAGGGLDALREALERFRGGRPQRDDLTMVEFVADGALGPLAEAPPAAQGLGLPWSMRVELDADALRRLDPVPRLVDAAVEVLGLHTHRVRLYVVLAELFANALEHGLLRLDSGLKADAEGFARYYRAREAGLAGLTEGRIVVAMRHEAAPDGGVLEITVEDSGPGFEPARAEGLPDDPHRLAGRGIALVRALCEAVRYEDGGRRVVARYRWHRAADEPAGGSDAG
ncbi:ATP-binding SpoIIE family protein phosphatase [Inmirania thermothiophila]|uniref:Histidine kinase-like protein n=1 Tax=Inmirania thermothiophila TaxID=1750597 RepID=A0A3N1Y8P8_9GAMM|nr:fused response regulator/phosphatase [Inmirania thermothiophila]ROR35155.1 histidine kinase-like protein [Inmirania thermothiophila]